MSDPKDMSARDPQDEDRPEEFYEDEFVELDSDADAAPDAEPGADDEAEGSTGPADAGGDDDDAAEDAAEADADDDAPEDADDADDDAGLDVPVVTISADDDIPYELRDDEDGSDAPRTGLVSEFIDLSRQQAAWLISNRETSAVSRSPLFYVSALIIGLLVFTVLMIGLDRVAPNFDGPDTTVAVVGIGEQAELFEQQLGLGVVDAADMADAEQLIRSGAADAALIPDTTGQGNDSVLALNTEPTEVLDKFSAQLQVTYLEPPAVRTEVSTVLGWGMALLLMISLLTLGAALYSNMRVEKRNRIAEVIAATIPARSSAWGRVYGLSLLSLVHIIIAVGIVMLGLSIASRPTLAFAMMPGLAWFAGLYLLAHVLYLSMFLWASTAANRRGRQIGYGVSVLLVVAGAFAPMIVGLNHTVLKWMSWIPFTAPVAAPRRFFAAQAQWWEGLISLGAVALMALIIFWLASSAYQRNLLRGSGRSGSRKLKAATADAGEKKAPAKKASAGASEDAESDVAESGSDEPDADESSSAESDSAESSAEGSDAEEPEADADDAKKASTTAGAEDSDDR